MQTVRMPAATARRTNVAVVSHADVIKAVLMLYLNMPLDCHLRLEISPCFRKHCRTRGLGAQRAGINLRFRRLLRANAFRRCGYEDRWLAVRAVCAADQLVEIALLPASCRILHQQR